MRCSPTSIDDLQVLLEQQAYIADRGLATSVYLALTLRRPLLLEGEAGVGKTEIAKVLASGLETELIRLQCYEGINEEKAIGKFDEALQRLCVSLKAKMGHNLDWEALRTDLHFLARHPSCLFQCWWNRGWWYDSAAAEPHYEPAGAQAPWHGAGPRLSALLERWRAAKAGPGALDDARAALDDDLDSPRALAAIDDAVGRGEGISDAARLLGVQLDE